jgi:hypothetical protein
VNFPEEYRNKNRRTRVSELGFSINFKTKSSDQEGD